MPDHDVGFNTFNIEVYFAQSIQLTAHVSDVLEISWLRFEESQHDTYHETDNIDDGLLWNTEYSS